MLLSQVNENPWTMFVQLLHSRDFQAWASFVFTAIFTIYSELVKLRESGTIYRLHGPTIRCIKTTIVLFSPWVKEFEYSPDCFTMKQKNYTTTRK